MRVARSGRRGLLVLAAPRRGQCPDHVVKLGSRLASILRYQVWRGFFWAKFQRFGANDGDACGCRDPLEDIVVATLPAIELWVKTLDLCGLGDDDGACSVVSFLGALSWSSGLLSLMAALVASSTLLIFYCLSLIFL
jgi:hypothetical protein